MPNQLNSEKLYEMYCDACTTLKSEPVSLELFSKRMLEAFFYLMSGMIEEETHILSMTFAITEDISCLIAPFKGGYIRLIFGTKEEIKERLEQYKGLIQNQSSVSPTELF